jgi:hypothetical protein
MALITYRLVKSKDLNNPNSKGYQTKYPQSVSLPAIMRVHIQDEKGDVKVRKVRYCPNETSIFFDEQDPKSEAKKIKFIGGLRTVDTDMEPNCWKIMELVDLNLSKDNRNHKKPAIFERYDPAAKHKAQLKQKEVANKNIEKFFTLNEDEKEAVAVAMGIRTIEVAAPTWQMELYKKAEENHTIFADLAKSNLRVAIIANKAIRYKIVEYKGQKWMWGSTELCIAPKGITQREALLNKLETEAATTDGINAEVKKWEQKLTGKTVVEKLSETVTASEALEQGMNAGVIMFHKGLGWRFTDPYDNLGEEREQFFGTGTDRKAKADAIEFISSRPDIKQEIFVRINDAAKS